MKHLILLISVFLFIQCDAQSKKLIRVKTIDNIEDTPIYPRLTETFEGVVKWKEQYEYIDDIDMNWITYMSDGLKVNGLMVRPKKAGNYPCIIFNRGGNRSFGQLLVAHAAMTLGELAAQGYIVVASNYRGNGRSEGKEQFGGDDVSLKKSLMRTFFSLFFSLFSILLCAQITGPEQPLAGPGGKAYLHQQVHFQDFASEADGYWLFEPIAPKPDSADVIVFLHGYGAIDPSIYGHWIRHLVLQGNIVIYPRYQM